MILHYLKIAWRNMLKYKTQSVLSILGLAIGFTAFSFTLSWIRYERGYDSHIKDVHNVYFVAKVDERETEGIGKKTSNPLPKYLQETFPEIEAATSADSERRTFYYSDSNNHRDSIPNIYYLYTDTSYFSVFYPDTKTSFSNELPQYSYMLNNNTYNILDKKKTFSSEFLGTIQNATYHSNVAFDYISFKNKSYEEDFAWSGQGSSTYIRVIEGTDFDALAKKLEHIEVEGSYQGIMSFKLIPLKEVHYTLPNDSATLKFTHLRIFAVVSALVILIALFNYLMLFVNRINMRSRELSLRKVNASSNKQMMYLLLVEFFIILFSSLFIGIVLTEILFPSFIKLSMIDAYKSFFLSEILIYAGVISVFSLLISSVPINVFMKRSIKENIQPDAKSVGMVWSNFTTISLLLQLIIGVLLIFCTSILIYQYNFLNRTDIGFNRHNKNSAYNYEHQFPIEEIKQIAGIEDILITESGLLPRMRLSSFTISSYKDEELPKEIILEIFATTFPNFISFFDIDIIEGRNINEGELGVCLINEKAQQSLNIKLGEELLGNTVVGVIPDLYINSPLLPVFSAMYCNSAEPNNYSLIYKFTHGTRYQTEKALEELGNKMGIINGVNLYNMDEIYSDYTKSERYLLIMLSIMTGVAILISVFGIYSMITLSCNKRRKEIAIRKANGAKAIDVFLLFFKQYIVITVTSCIIAFPIGAYIMQRWLEQYTHRISMEWWIFIVIFILIIMIVLLSIFSRVSRVAKENPAVVMKSK